MSKEWKLSKTQYLILQGYLYDIHLSGKACVFSELAGHVDGLCIRIVESKEKYNNHIYGSAASHRWIQGGWEKEQTSKQFVDGIISDIEEAMSKKEEILAEEKIEKEKKEREQYEELKRKFRDK